MFSRYKNLQLGIIFLALFILFSCGKVVQQTSEETNNNNHFVLNFKTNQIYFKPVEVSLSNLTSANRITLPLLKGSDYEKFSQQQGWVTAFFKNKNLFEVTVKDGDYYSSLISAKEVNVSTKNIVSSSFLFDDNKPIYSLIRGYKKQKVYELAWGYCMFDKTLSPTQVKPNNPNKVAVNQKYIFKADFFDKNKIKVVSSKKSQIFGSFSQNSKELSLSSKQISREYDYYLVALYANEKDFQLKMISSETVSKNQVLNLDYISDLDTFRSLIFIEAFRNNALDLDVYDGLNQLFDQAFFNSLNYQFSSFNLKLFNVKKPQFKYTDAFISECVFILELAFIDSAEVINYIKQNEKKLLSKQQQDLLISTIKTLKLAKVE